MKHKINNTLDIIFNILFTIYFATIFISTIFFNKTININYNKILMIVIPLILYAIIFVIYYKFSDKKLLKKDINIGVCILFIGIIFIIQLFIIKKIYNIVGWDCGKIINDALASIKNGTIEDYSYYIYYPNNIEMFLIMRYLFAFTSKFIEISNLYNVFYVASVFNIILLDIAALFTFLTVQRILERKSSYLSLIFILVFILFTPYINIPYTDTITMMFPILIFYLYICIKQSTNKKKYLLAFLLGIVSIMGFYIKPTTIIVIIAITIKELLNINKKNIPKNILVVCIIIIGMLTGKMIYEHQKSKYFSSSISEEMLSENEMPFTHFLMMGMQQNKIENIPENGGKNTFLYGAYNEEDVQNTKKVIGIENKKSYNFRIIKERLHNFGFWGYIKFLFNKSNWILSDGTFYYGCEGTTIPNSYGNQSNAGKNLQKFVTYNTKQFKNITANIMQTLWILLILGLVFSYNKKEDKYINVAKLSIIGIVLFILLFEGRSRYLVNYIPLFIVVGTYGLKNSLKQTKKIVKKKIEGR